MSHVDYNNKPNQSLLRHIPLNKIERIPRMCSKRGQFVFLWIKSRSFPSVLSIFIQNNKVAERNFNKYFFEVVVFGLKHCLKNSKIFNGLFWKLVIFVIFVKKSLSLGKTFLSKFFFSKSPFLFRIHFWLYWIKSKKSIFFGILFSNFVKKDNGPREITMGPFSNSTFRFKRHFEPFQIASLPKRHQESGLRINSSLKLECNDLNAPCKFKEYALSVFVETYSLEHK